MVHVFILDPEHCVSGYYDKLKDRLSRIPDFTYYVFISGVAGNETELARTVEDIFEGEQLRIYCCGNLTTARNVVEGIHDLSRVEIAIVPQEHTQYLSYIGDEDRFRDIETLINGKVIRADYIKTNNGIAINYVSFGIDAHVYKTYEYITELKLFGSRIPWILANIHSMIASPNQIYNITLDEKSLVRKATSVYVGNTPNVVKSPGADDNYDISDGMAAFIFSYRPNFFSRLIYYFKVMRGSGIDTGDDRHYISEQVNTVRVRHINGMPLLCILDGEIISAPDWRIEVVKQGLKLVVPKEASA